MILLPQIERVINKYQSILDNLNSYWQLNDNDKEIIRKVLNLILKHLIPIYNILKTPKIPANFREIVNRAANYIVYVYRRNILSYSHYSIITGLLANMTITKAFYIDELLPSSSNYERIAKYYATIKTNKDTLVKNITNIIELINYILMDKSSNSIYSIYYRNNNINKYNTYIYPYLKNLANYLIELLTYINNNDEININKAFILLLRYLQSYKNDDYFIPTITHLVNIECYKLIIPKSKSTSKISSKAKSLTFPSKTSSNKKVKSY